MLTALGGVDKTANLGSPKGPGLALSQTRSSSWVPPGKLTSRGQPPREAEKAREPLPPSQKGTLRAGEGPHLA